MHRCAASTRSRRARCRFWRHGGAGICQGDAGHTQGDGGGEGAYAGRFLECDIRARFVSMQSDDRRIPDGLAVSIRAYGFEERMQAESILRTDRYTRVARTFNTIEVWAGVRMDAIGMLFIFGLTTYLVYGPVNVNPSQVGFSLDMAFGFARLILYLVIEVNETQSAYTLLPMTVIRKSNILSQHHSCCEQPRAAT
jgi:hypothetical protein